MAVAHRDGAPTDAGGIHGVVVVRGGVAERGPRVAQRVVERRERAPRRPGEREWPTTTMPVVAAVVDVVLDPQERGEHRIPSPPRAAVLGRPPLVVVGRAPDRAHRIHGRGAAGAPAAQVAVASLTLRAGGHELGPDFARFT